MLEMIAPTARLRAAFVDARDDWGPGVHEDGFGLLSSHEVNTTEAFDAWLAQQSASVTSTCRWIVEDGHVLGGIALRHGAGAATQRLGHIGFGVRPSARRRGVATWGLGRMLDIARTRGMPRVLLVCEADNLASARTIESLGGVLEVTESPEADTPRRYWIDISRARSRP